MNPPRLKASRILRVGLILEKAWGSVFGLIHMHLRVVLIRGGAGAAGPARTRAFRRPNLAAPWRSGAQDGPHSATSETCWVLDHRRGRINPARAIGC